MIAVFATIVVLTVVTPAEPSRWLVIAIGALLGAVTGVLQLRAMSEEKTRFIVASSALEVRKAMAASKYGRLAIYLLWFSGAALLVCAFIQKEGLFIRWLSGYAAFALVRDSIALKGCFMLQKMAQAD